MQSCEAQLPADKAVSEFSGILDPISDSASSLLFEAACGVPVGGQVMMSAPSGPGRE